MLRFSAACSLTLLAVMAYGEAIEPAAPSQGLMDDAMLAADDECQADDEACTLNAMQLRGQKLASASAVSVEDSEKWSWGFNNDDDDDDDDDYGNNVDYYGGSKGAAIAGGIGGIIGAIAAAAAAAKANEKNPLQHYALNCWSACGSKEGFCEAYCGHGNACCNYNTKAAPECQQAHTFPILTFATCVKTNMKPPAGGGGGGGGQVQSVGGGGCSDQDNSCAAWAQSGECQKNPKYMQVKCCSSCQRAGGQSQATGQAMAAAPPIQPAQPTAAGGADCSDGSRSCGAWAAAGECDKNPAWMKENCKVSCKVCQKSASLGTSSAVRAAAPTTMVATTTPVWATSNCQTATANDPNMKACYEAVTWVFSHGLTSNPEWFPGLTFTSPFEAVQYKMHADGKCPMPCAPSNAGCQSAMANEGGECYKAVIFAKNDGIHAHPEWFPELKPDSPIDDFQMHLHNQNATLCPKPCQN